MPLDPSTLIARTTAGDAELSAPRHGLAIAQRRLLVRRGLGDDGVLFFGRGDLGKQAPGQQITDGLVVAALLELAEEFAEAGCGGGIGGVG